jgi:hypothetical protein
VSSTIGESRRPASSAALAAATSSGAAKKPGELVLVVDPASDLLKAEQIHIEVQGRIEIAHAQHGVQKPHISFSLGTLRKRQAVRDTSAHEIAGK